MPIPLHGIRPLPLAGHWNLGEGRGGYDPAYQLDLIRRGHHVLPWLLMPNAYAHPEDPRWIAYYQEAVRLMAAWQLPISLVSTQWDSILSWEDKYWNLPLEENPNVVTASGERRRAVSPFGSIDPWRSAGEWWGSGAMMKQLQTHLWFSSSRITSTPAWTGQRSRRTAVTSPILGACDIQTRSAGWSVTAGSSGTVRSSKG
jgi:hypothetical protein